VREYWEWELRGRAKAVLPSFLEMAGPHLQELCNQNDIEERPPRIEVRNGVSFLEPGGWVGLYSSPDGRPVVRVIPDPSKLNEEELETVRKDVIQWLTLFGAPFWEVVLQNLTTSIIDDVQLSMNYSRIVCELTDALLTHRLSRLAIPKTYVGNSIRGKLDGPATISARQKDPSKVVCTYQEFSPNTPLNLLLTRLHAVMAGTLARAAKMVEDPWSKIIRNRVGKHVEVLQSSPFAGLLENSMTFDPYDLTTSRRLVAEASKSVYSQSLLEVWEAFSRRRHLQSRVNVQFDQSLKPMSKVYELWCLATVLQLLSGMTGNQVKNDTADFPATFSIGPRVRLYYGAGRKREFTSRSNIMAVLRENGLSVGPGRPDFIITSSPSTGKPRLVIGDAKYKFLRGIDTSDVERFLTYIFDYMGPKDPGTPVQSFLFHLDDQHAFQKVTSKDDQIEVFLICLRPSTLNDVLPKLENLLNQVVG